jgi:small-conductance mechanosensitive channel
MGPVLVDLSWESAAGWSAAHGSRIVTILVAAVAASWLLRRLIPAALARALVRAEAESALDLQKRANTLSGVIVHTGQIMVVGIAALMVLGELDFNVTPFLTGLGITGIAIGLGAQSLVRDTINGIFIIAENQYGRGDLVAVAGVQGWVEEVNLRRTVLRDADGTVYTVPNGEVKVAGNFTRGYSGVSLLVPLAAGSDLDRAISAIDAAGQELAADPRLGALVVEPPKVARVEAITDKGLTLRVTGRAVPGAQFEVAGALRRRIKRAFDEAELRFGEAPPGPPAGGPSLRPA